MKTNLDLYEFVQRFPDAIISCRAGDLSLFGRKLIADGRLEWERQMAAAAAEKADYLITSDTTRAKLGGISRSTLYRLMKANVLPAVTVAGKQMFRISDVVKIVESHD